MQEYRKLLCVNKIRETKRLIENMLIPILSLVVAAAVVGYQIVINFFPIIRKINACNLRICYLVFGFLILYSFGVCFINVKPAIIINAYSARTAHPFRRNGAPFRFKLSKAQQVD